MVNAFIALGSNIGDRRRHLDLAIQALRTEPGIVVLRVSSYHETEPVGGPAGQGLYLNAAVELQTNLDALQLLDALLAIEQKLGRVRQVPLGPRTIDLDLLLYGSEVRRDSKLTLPHPRMHERRFVLAPLAEIAPQVRHPVLGITIQELLARLGPRGELSGLKAMVTGSSTGIGRAVALALAEGGADVIVHRRGERRAAEAVADEARARGVRTGLIIADLTVTNDCRRLLEEAWGMWDGLDIWINNAGADTLTGVTAKWPFEEKLRQLLAVDVTATMYLSREVGAWMKARRRGVILNMGWDQAETGMEGDSGQLFGAAKGAVMAFTRSLALTLAPEVRVNCLAPGWIRTAWGENASTAWQERVIQETPLARWGTPEDVAATARWLCSPAAIYVTGQIVRVNGGAVR
jgi:2-amino-4-hydroxy-6-hydroxymethyldihydropteridine diphosphokinase